MKIKKNAPVQAQTSKRKNKPAHKKYKGENGTNEL